MAKGEISLSANAAVDGESFSDGRPDFGQNAGRDDGVAQARVDADGRVSWLRCRITFLANCRRRFCENGVQTMLIARAALMAGRRGIFNCLARNRFT